VLPLIHSRSEGRLEAASSRKLEVASTRIRADRLPKILVVARKVNGLASPRFGSEATLSHLRRLAPASRVRPEPASPACSYFLKKLRHALVFGRDSEHAAHLEYFQKNFFELRNMRSEKLLLDYHAKQVTLPPSVRQKLLVLDMDETLVHCCNFDHRVGPGTVTVPFKQAHSDVFSFLKLNVRPGLDRFLRRMADHFQLVVFTASDRDYAQAVLRHLDPHQFVCKLLTRDSCSYTTHGHLVKDLRVFGQKRLADVVLVDNTLRCCFPQLDNGVPVLSFLNDPRDSELEELAAFLVSLSQQADVSQFLRGCFRLHRADAAASPAQFAEEVFRGR